jgi:hypothetical protein
MKPRSILVVLSCLVVGCVGAPGARPRDPVELFGGLRSYQTPAEAQAKLGARDWRIHDRRLHPPDDKRPKFERLSAELRWRECEQDGTLSISFINDRLETTVFYPSDFESCVRSLTTRGLITRSSAGDQRRRVYTGESEGRRFVAATDTRLESEINAWITRYS